MLLKRRQCLLDRLVPRLTATSAFMAEATLKDHQRLDELVKKLTSLIKKLPTTLPCGSKDGPIATNLCDLTHDDTEGPYYSFNKSWERVFQRSEDQKELLVVRGKYGLDIALTYIVHFSKAPRIEENGGLGLLAVRVESLITLIETVYFLIYNSMVSMLTKSFTERVKLHQK